MRCHICGRVPSEAHCVECHRAHRRHWEANTNPANHQMMTDVLVNFPDPIVDNRTGVRYDDSHE